MIKPLEFFRKVLLRDLTIPNFSHFREIFEKVYNLVNNDEKYQGGKVASYIPSL